MKEGITLDTGALLALERGHRDIVVLLQSARVNATPIAIPAGVLAQVFRDGARQAPLSRLLGSPNVEVVPLDAPTAKDVGRLLSVRKQRDVVDASVVLCARRRRHAVLTSDPDDLLALDPNLRVVRV